MTHLLEPAIRSKNTAANDCESLPFDLLAQSIVFPEMDLLVEAAETPEFLAIKEHEHAGCKRAMQLGEVLENVVPDIKHLVDPAPFPADDVCSHAMEPVLRRPFHTMADQRLVGEFNIGIEEKDVRSISLRRTLIASHRRHPPRNHGDVQPVAEA